MYKKVIWWCLVFLFLLVNISKADIQWVSFSYCDDSNTSSRTVVVNIQKNESPDLCFSFQSNSSTPVKVVYGFSVWVVTEGTQLCDADMSTGNNFSKLFVNSGDRSIILYGSGPQTVTEKIKIPVGMKWMQYWCFSYALADSISAWAMFNMVVRKAVPLNIFIEWDPTIKNSLTLLKSTWWSYSTNRQVKMEVDKSNKATLTFSVKNDGNIEQQVTITGSLYNIFWFEKDFSSPVTNIIPWETSDIKINIWVIPFYKSFFTVEFTLQNTPVFSFDATSLDDSSWY